MAKIPRKPRTLADIETEARRALAVTNRALPDRRNSIDGPDADRVALRAACYAVVLRELLDNVYEDDGPPALNR